MFDKTKYTNIRYQSDKFKLHFKFYQGEAYFLSSNYKLTSKDGCSTDIEK